MIFTVTSIMKNKDLFNVVSDTGEGMIVTAVQILNVLLQGYQFTNVKLTKKGFAVATPQGTRYTQLNMSKETAAKVKFIVDKQNEAEKQTKLMVQQMKQQMSQRTQQTQQTQCRSIENTIRPKAKSQTQKINRTNNREKVVYRGDVYLSVESLCKKFNRDVNTFRKLRDKGYTMDEALGLMPLRPESELTMTRQQINKRIDSSFSTQGGEF